MSCVLVDVFRAEAVVHSVPNSEQALREECGLRCVDKVRGTGATLYSCSGLRPACLVRGPPAHSGSSLLWGWWDLQQALSLVNGGGDSSAQARDRCWDRVGQAPACACVTTESGTSSLLHESGSASSDLGRGLLSPPSPAPSPAFSPLPRPSYPSPKTHGSLLDR